MSTDSFYSDIQIPLNYEFEENDFEFANAVTIADKFAEATAINAKLSRDTEQASEEFADADTDLDTVKAELKLLRRQILHDAFEKIKVSIKPEALDAFILVNAGEHRAQLLELEDQEKELFRKRAKALKKLETCKHRMRTLERTMNYLTEWLNYDKFQHRMYDSSAANRI